jgi:Glycosyl hydrolase family 26
MSKREERRSASVKPKVTPFPRILISCTAVLVLVGLGVGLYLGVVSRAVVPGPVEAECAMGSVGVYAGAGNPAGVKSFGQAIGCRPVYAMDFTDGASWQTMDNPSRLVSQWQGSGYSMIWGVPILPNTGGYTLAAGATGAYNQYFVTLAKAFVADGQGSSIIRLGWEFNGSWFTWAANGQAANFIGYWQQIVNSMRSVSGANFKFEWNPTLGDQGVGNLANYYPGNSYVDYIGADVYDQNWATYPGAATEFTTMETEAYGLNWLVSFAAAQGKPITLPEWGLGSGPGNNGLPFSAANEEVAGGDNPTFINDMSAWIKANNVFEATFFDVGQSLVTSTSNPNSLAALVNGNHLHPNRVHHT